MLRRMRKTLGACLAAGAVGLGATLAAPPEPAKHEAVKVECAWQADARSFKLALKVEPKDDGLEVTGQVADEATRDHVLRVARQACAVSVHDKIDVGEGSSDPALRDAAKAAVTKYLAGRGSNVGVVGKEDGVVVLTGHVETTDDKLDAGRCLRDVPGCTRVENRIVATVQHGGGAVIAPTEHPRAALAPAEHPRAEIAPAERPRAAIAAAERRPAQFAAVCHDPAKVVDCATKDGCVPLPDAPTPTLPAVPPTKLVRLQVRHEPETSVMPTALPGYPGANPSVRLYAAKTDVPPTLFGRLRQAVTPAQREAPPPVARLEPVAAEETPRPKSGVMTASAAPAEWPAAHATGPKPEPRPAVEVAESRPAAEGGAKITIVTEKQVEAKPASPEQMKVAIVAACGRLVRDVRLEPRTDGKLEFHVYTSVKSQQDVSERITGLPEMQATKTHIVLHVQ